MALVLSWLSITGRVFLAISLVAICVRGEEKPLFDPNGLSLILGGNGNVTTKGPADSVFGSNVSLVQKGTLGLPFQLGIRQTFEHQRVATDDGDISVNTFSTKLFYDVIFLRFARKVDVSVGANWGVLYGNTSLTWQAGPEFGIRWWVKPTVAVIGRVDYPFDLNRGPENILNYFIGVQINLEK